MLSVVAALDVSLDIFAKGRRAFRFTTTRKSRLFYELFANSHSCTTTTSPFYTLNCAVGVVFRRFKGTTTTHLPRTNTKNDFPRRHDTVERG